MTTEYYNSGAGTNIKYDFETSIGSGGTPTYPFGWGTKVTINRNNNMERIYGVGNRNAVFTVPKKFEGTMTLEFIMGNAYWLRAVLGTQGAAGGAGPYTHAFTEANTPPSMVVLVGSDLGTNDMVTTYTGVVVNQCRINMTTNEVVKVTLDCLYQSESTALSGLFSAVADTYNDPMSFAMGSISYAGQTMGSTYSGVVQNAELTINNSIELIYGLGSRTLQNRVAKTREYNIKMNYALISVGNTADVFPNMLGNTSAPYTPATGNITGVNLTFSISNGLATTSLRSLVFTFTAASTFLNTSSIIFDVNEIIKQDVDGWAHSISSCVYTDNNNAGIGA
jgi:hypothetical protein